jgi:hypothetical protein
MYNDGIKNKIIEISKNKDYINQRLLAKLMQQGTQ